jgi:site-specific DNA-methyltransferase (adenine-specific)/site-specific DNA-methyltransferase (cytosine-N4-specific)
MDARERSTLRQNGEKGVDALMNSAAAGLGTLFKPCQSVPTSGERETRRVENYSESERASRGSRGRIAASWSRQMWQRRAAEKSRCSVTPGISHSPREGLYVGDCLEALAIQEAASINLIMTSPPYAEARKTVYGGIPADQYVGWWLARAAQFRRVLTQDGSLVVNIKEGCEDGERSTYVIELILAMRRAGWLWTEEYIWHKRNSVPGKWHNRLRDAWERCLHFTLDRDFAMYQDAVMIPLGDWAKTRLANPSEADRIRDRSASGSPFGRNISNWIGRDLVYPTNVLHVATECSFVGHSAAFPEELPEFFIKLFTRQGNLVCDPFMGSGTTGVVCERLDRKFIGIDILKENIRLAETRIKETRLGAVAD